ncbi:hypothetical protein MIMGU_mgv1a017307mg [Erythranthe guttata]|uniref:Uncharacterized protein n=1 Tax=Erythranthe guttata TaxID=4155 RepID=A0A022RYR5_ERYGU|nr:hypothetical protein MIMGU_mgv1a017307mg [Erythranthe guttata]
MDDTLFQPKKDEDNLIFFSKPSNRMICLMMISSISWMKKMTTTTTVMVSCRPISVGSASASSRQQHERPDSICTYGKTTCVP